MIFRILEDQFAEKSRLSKAADQRFMQLALTLGRRGQGRTWPNPAVGAVVAKDGVIVGRGWTQAGGRPHAEPEALGRAGEAARGATLYVTLEPCSHVDKSPPCADVIITAGSPGVVSAIEDPNPEVAGQGHAPLRAAGIAVDMGCGARRRTISRALPAGPRSSACHPQTRGFRRQQDRRGRWQIGPPLPATRPRRASICCARNATPFWWDRHLYRPTMIPLLTCRLPAWPSVRRFAWCWTARCGCSGCEPAGSFRPPDAAMGCHLGACGSIRATKLGAAGRR